MKKIFIIDELKKADQLSVISLFSGCGGMDLGFQGNFSFNGKFYPTNNFKIIWANEINSAACKTYRHNFNNEVMEGDIWEKMKYMPTYADLIIGGFPCQDISINNKNARGVFGKRSGLYKAMIQAIDRVKPKCFVAENVKSLLNKNNKASLKKVIADFKKLGYSLNYGLYNAADYGVPQTRERVFFIGTKNQNYQPPKPTHSEKTWISSKQILNDLENNDEDILHSHIWSKAARGSDQGNRRLYEDRPGFTIRAECHGNTHYHYSLNRRISMRESARLQSFPDEFIFKSKLRETERQIGNAVPPVLAWHIAKSIKDMMNNTTIEINTLNEKLSA